MSGDTPKSMTGSGSLRDVPHLDAARARFESAWRLGLRPKAEDFLADEPEEDRPSLLPLLLKAELEILRRFGELPEPDALLARLPGHDDLVRAILASVGSTGADGAPASSGVAGPAGGEDLPAQLGRLDYPHIVPVYDLGLPFVVSKYVEGGSLTARLEQVRPTPADYRNKIHELLAPDIFIAETANALTKAERQKLIHVGLASPLHAQVMQTPPVFHSHLPLVQRAIPAADHGGAGGRGFVRVD